MGEPIKIKLKVPDIVMFDYKGVIMSLERGSEIYEYIARAEFSVKDKKTLEQFRKAELIIEEERTCEKCND